MKALWITIACLSFAATAIVWSFAAGWHGGITWLPNADLLTTGEWPIWAGAIVLQYGPPALGIWALRKARNRK